MNYLFQIILFLLPFISLCTVDVSSKKYLYGVNVARNIASNFFDMFRTCVKFPMPNNKQFQTDLQSFINYPSKTTIGFAPKFTSNRKFFGNMISSTAFKEMLRKDEEYVTNNFVQKLKFCDAAVMDQEFFKFYYDRDIDTD